MIGPTALAQDAPTLDNQLTPGRRTRRRVRRSVRRLPVKILLTVLVAVELYPLLWIILGSFKTQNEFVTKPTWDLPHSFSFSNYAAALTTGNMGLNLRNSALVTIPSIVLMIALGVSAAFALEIMVWRGRNSVLMFILAGIMVPGQMILVPLFIAYFHVGLTNSLWPMILTYTVMGVPLTVFLMTAYFRGVPRETFEAATIDGASILQQFVRIGVPLMRNAIVTIGLVEFFSVWNDLLIALTFTTRQQLATVQVGLLNFSDQYGSTEYGPLFAAISINIVGILIIYLALNKQIMAGLTSGSIKG